MALEAVTPFALVAVRLVTGAAMLVALSGLRGGPVLPPKGSRGVCLLLGLIIGAHLLIQAIGLQYTTAINTAWIIGVIPVMIALGSALFLRERLPAVGWLGVAVATGGVLMVTMRTPPDFGRAHLGDHRGIDIRQNDIGAEEGRHC